MFPKKDPSRDHPRSHSSGAPRSQLGRRPSFHSSDHLRSRTSEKVPVQETPSGGSPVQSSGRSPMQETSSGQPSGNLPVQGSSNPKSPAQDSSSRKPSSQSSSQSSAPGRATIELFEHFYNHLIDEERRRAQRRRHIEHELEQMFYDRKRIDHDTIQRKIELVSLNAADKKGEASRRLLMMHPSRRNSSIGELSSRTFSVDETSTRASSVDQIREALENLKSDEYIPDKNSRDEIAPSLDGASDPGARFGSTSQDPPSPKSIPQPSFRKVSFQFGGDSSSESPSAITSPDLLPAGSKIVLPKPALLDLQADTPSMSQMGSPEPVPIGHVSGVLGPVDHAQDCNCVTCRPQGSGVSNVTLDDDAHQLPRPAALEEESWVAKANKRLGM